KNSWDFFFSSRRRHTRFDCDWSSDVCSSDLEACAGETEHGAQLPRYSYQHQEDDHHADDLQRDADHVAQRGKLAAVDTRPPEEEIGRASCRERVQTAVGGGGLEKQMDRPARS